MSLDKDTLANLIVTKLKAADSSTDNTAALVKWTAIADAIVTHIKAAAAVSTSGSDPQGGTVTSTGTVS